MSETMNAAQAANYLGISKWLVYELAKRKDLPSIRLGGRILFRKTSIDEWLQMKESSNLPMVDTTFSGQLRRIEA